MNYLPTDLFLQNKYHRWYYNITTRAGQRQLPPETYVENHHIIPRSLGGGNQKENLATLTGREHYICHWLLTKMTSGDSRRKMCYALHAMGSLISDKLSGRYKNSRAFEYNKVECNRLKSLARKGKLSGEKNYNFGKRWNEEQRARVRGHTRCLGLTKAPHSEESKLKMAESANKRWTAEERAKQSARRLEWMHEFICPHCGKHGKGVSNYNRWHGNNCKSLDK